MHTSLHASSQSAGIGQRLGDGAAHLFDDVRHLVGPKARNLASDAESLAHHGAQSLRDGSRELRARAGQAREQGLRYVRDEPVKSVLIAAFAAGALMAVGHWLARRRMD